MPDTSTFSWDLFSEKPKAGVAGGVSAGVGVCEKEDYGSEGSN